MDEYFYDLINNTGSLSVQDIAMRIGFSMLLGVIIFLSYRFTHRNCL